jgi:hypothetical protein
VGMWCQNKRHQFWRASRSAGDTNLGIVRNKASLLIGEEDQKGQLAAASGPRRKRADTFRNPEIKKGE